eukprot:3940830-Rhodomonas_salina.1
MLCSGRPGDASYGGEIVTVSPGGDVITLVFEDNMYRLPFPEQQETSRESKKLRQTSAVEHPLFAAPMTLPSLLSDEQHMQVAHDKWGHPLESTARKNHTGRHHHGKSFPRDFLQLLPKTSCLVCPLSKGARPYKHSAKFKEVGTQRVPVQRGGGAQIPQPLEMTMHVTNEMAVAGLLNGCVNVSIDFAHAICKGVNQELYYLEIIAHCVEFSWGIPTQDSERPEIHLQQFMDLMGLRFRTIRHDNAAEFAR